MDVGQFSGAVLPGDVSEGQPSNISSCALELYAPREGHARITMSYMHTCAMNCRAVVSDPP